MTCPICGDGNLRVLETRPHPTGVERRRRCSNGHRFGTLEEISVNDWQVIKRSGRQAAFRKGAVEQGIRIAGTGRLSTEKVSELASRVVVRLASLARSAPVFSTEEIGRIVLDELRKTSPTSACRFAIAFLSPRGALASARDFVVWLDRTYPKTAGSAQRISPWSVGGRPTLVIKKTSSGEPDPFDIEKLRRSIAVAAKGRGPQGAAGPVPELQVEELVERVLVRVKDQPIVTSGQLEGAALAVLLDWDELAYLRFASVAMRFDQPSDFKSQAEAIAERRTVEGL